MYNDLLREGRVWDMQILLERVLHSDWPVMLHSFVKITGHSTVKNGLRQIIKDWTCSAQEDASTTLALLDLITKEALEALSWKHMKVPDDYLDLATPLALSLARKDATLTKSRGYTQWIIAKAYCIATRGLGMIKCPESLKFSQGITFKSELGLPIYIPKPMDFENPGWHRLEMSPDIVKAMKLAVNNARDLGNYETESWALRFLIMISNDPLSEFEDLCELLYEFKGQFFEYLQTLQSSYLVSTSDQSKMRLKAKLEEMASSHDLKESNLSSSDLWIFYMIIYALEREGPRADLAFETAGNFVPKLGEFLLATIKTKFPNYLQELN
jgi:hypothetical protein